MPPKKKVKAPVMPKVEVEVEMGEDENEEMESAPVAPPPKKVKKAVAGKVATKKPRQESMRQYMLRRNRVEGKSRGY